MKIAILGATGVVGNETLKCLEALKVEFDELILLASARSAGKVLSTPFDNITVQEVNEAAFEGTNYAIFSAGGETSKHWAPIANKKGCTVIDNSSAFRYQDEIPLIVPEINSDATGNAKLIANPNCTTAILAVALYPIYKNFGLKRVIASTYQATSGGGKAAMDELEAQTKNYLERKEISNTNFAHPIPFNLIPQIDKFQENGYTREEMKVTWETRKIFGVPDLKISCTAVRIPTFRAHAESVTVETEKPINPDQVREILKKSPSVKVVDDPENLQYPMPLTSTKKFDVEVGRIRKNDVFGDHGLDFFVCGDQLLKGAALNAVQILQVLINKKEEV